jgi:hypothetical protein
MTAVKGKLEIDDDPKFENKEWKVADALWGILFVTLVLALAGLFGSGPISEAWAEENGVELSYRRYLRFSDPSAIRMKFKPSGSETQISFPSAYLDQLKIEDITPRPKIEFDDGQVYTFIFDTAGEGKDFSVKVNFEPRTYGFLRGSVMIEGLAEVYVRQLIYP